MKPGMMYKVTPSGSTRLLFVRGNDILNSLDVDLANQPAEGDLLLCTGFLDLTDLMGSDGAGLIPRFLWRNQEILLLNREANTPQYLEEVPLEEP